MGDELQYFSQIRIGDRIIYNGVNGDAFCFGEKPPDLSNENRKNETMSHTAHIIRMTPTTVNGELKRDLKSEECPYSSSSDAESGSSMTSYLGKKSSSSSLSQLNVEASHEALTNSTYRQEKTGTNRRPETALTTQRGSGPSMVSILNSAGLPPILPPPPSAHLPPPLPSRPPSSAPSPASSVSSLTSFDRSCSPPLVSPTPPQDPHKNPQSPDPNLNTNPNYFRSFFFRSSGTIKVEAPSRDAPYNPTAHPPPVSPPPLPLPVTITFNSPLSPVSDSLPTNQHPCCSDDHLQSATRLSDSDKPPHASSTSAHSVKTTSTEASSRVFSSSTSSTNDSDDEQEDLQEDKDIHGESLHLADTELILTPAQFPIACGELVDARDGDKVFPRRKSKGNVHKDGSRTMIPPELDSIRKQSMTYADVISSVLMFYKISKAGQKKKKIPYVQPKVEKATRCKKCGREFGLRCFRYHCIRCRKTYCDACCPVTRVDHIEQDSPTSLLSRVCQLCQEEIAYETSKGAYRGLWSEFKKMRDEARDNRGLDVTSSKGHKSLETQSIMEATPGLTSLCLRFLGEVHQQQERQTRPTFLASYLHFENSALSRQKSKLVKTRECQACGRQLRLLTEIRDCCLCEQTFCLDCTYRTLQLYLPPGTDLAGHVIIESIQFRVKETEQDEVPACAASETFRVCADCEDDVTRNIRIHEFNNNIPDLEAELFDLQRQIEHALTFGPHMPGMQRSVSAHNLYHVPEHETLTTNIKLANHLYERYMKAYDLLSHLKPQTSGQRKLHKHIKQASL